MAHIQSSIALSLDNYIAHKDGSSDWIPSNVSGYIINSINHSATILMGVNTYNDILEHHGVWSFKERNTYVVSHYDTNTLPDSNVSFLVENPLSKIRELKIKSEEDLFVVGGGVLITSLINNKLLDELTIYLIPELLGEGIPFLRETSGCKLSFTDCEQGNNFVKLNCRFANL